MLRPFSLEHPMTEPQSAPALRGLRWTDFVFAALMIALAVFCFFLGNWQMQRLGEKEAQIAAVAAMQDAPPVAVPASAEWENIDLDALNFQPVTLTGSFRYNQTLTVFTSLSDARGQFGGPGYWVVTPFVLADGGTVMINRGFVPAEYQEKAILGEFNGEESAVETISGLLRPGEDASFATPEPNMSSRIEWLRDTDRLAAMVDPALAPVAPFYVDLPAGNVGSLPQGGETVFSFANNHFSYAFTWYGFSVVAIVMLVFWLWRQRRLPATKS